MIIVIWNLKDGIAKENFGSSINNEEFIHNPAFSFTGSLPVNLYTLLNVILLSRGGKLGQVDSLYLKTTDRLGIVSATPLAPMNLMAWIVHHKKRLFLSPSLMTRVFYKPNTACICPQNPLMIRALLQVVGGFNTE
ncbi:hypothetical protein D3C75_921320 [compost metagenome]